MLTYFAKKNASGLYDVFSTGVKTDGTTDTGTKVSTGTADSLKNYGLSESQLATPTPPERVSRIAARTDTSGGQPDTSAPGAGDGTPTEQSLAEGLAKNAGQPKSYDQILKEKTDAANAAIDAIRGQFADVINQDTQAGAVRAARVRASNVSSGLVGSDFGSAAAEADASKTNDVIKADMAARDAKINEVLTGIPGQADEAYKAAQDAYRTNAEAGITALKSFRDSQKQSVDQTIAAVAASGASFDTLTQSPNYQKLLDAYGGNEAAVKGAFINAIPKEEKIGSTTVGNKYVTFYRDPITGQQNMITMDLPAELGTDEKVSNVFSNGQVAITKTVHNPDGSTTESVRIETPAGFKGTGSGSNTQLTQDLNDVESALTYGIQGTPFTAGRGKDGKVDPYLYTALYNQILQDHGQSGGAAFLKKYPPSKELNPDAASLGILPTEVQNALEAASNQSGGFGGGQ